ncbi:hypothetical protein CLOM_g15373 [Closterium sp. NIES-68]|nr:hypothetical protein CLOM_g15373 [Closterium sp. NIES-68]GJP86617.1 hypothetical protein CLOP_g16618 [Closterium sp. NIES-67]
MECRGDVGDGGDGCDALAMLSHEWSDHDLRLLLAAHETLDSPDFAEVFANGDGSAQAAVTLATTPLFQVDAAAPVCADVSQPLTTPADLAALTESLWAELAAMDGDFRAATWLDPEPAGPSSWQLIENLNSARFGSWSQADSHHPFAKIFPPTAATMAGIGGAISAGIGISTPVSSRPSGDVIIPSHPLSVPRDERFGCTIPRDDRGATPVRTISEMQREWRLGVPPPPAAAAAAASAAPAASAPNCHFIEGFNFADVTTSAGRRSSATGSAASAALSAAAASRAPVTPSTAAVSAPAAAATATATAAPAAAAAAKSQAVNPAPGSGKTAREAVSSTSSSIRGTVMASPSTTQPAAAHPPLSRPSSRSIACRSSAMRYRWHSSGSLDLVRCAPDETLTKQQQQQQQQQLSPKLNPNLSPSLGGEQGPDLSPRLTPKRKRASLKGDPIGPSCLSQSLPANSTLCSGPHTVTRRDATFRAVTGKDVATFHTVTNPGEFAHCTGTGMHASASGPWERLPESRVGFATASGAPGFATASGAPGFAPVFGDPPFARSGVLAAPIAPSRLTSVATSPLLQAPHTGEMHLSSVPIARSDNIGSQRRMDSSPHPPTPHHHSPTSRPLEPFSPFFSPFSSPFSSYPSSSPFPSPLISSPPSLLPPRVSPLFGSLPPPSPHPFRLPSTPPTSYPFFSNPLPDKPRFNKPLSGSAFSSSPSPSKSFSSYPPPRVASVLGRSCSAPLITPASSEPSENGTAGAGDIQGTPGGGAMQMGAAGQGTTGGGVSRAEAPGTVPTCQAGKLGCATVEACPWASPSIHAPLGHMGAATCHSVGLISAASMCNAQPSLLSTTLPLPVSLPPHSTPPLPSLPLSAALHVPPPSSPPGSRANELEAFFKRSLCLETPCLEFEVEHFFKRSQSVGGLQRASELEAFLQRSLAISSGDSVQLDDSDRRPRVVEGKGRGNGL